MGKNKRKRRTQEEIDAGLTLDQINNGVTLETVLTDKDALADLEGEPRPDNPTEEATALQELEDSKSVGLGDVVEKVTKATGIKQVVKWLNGNEDCGSCEERQKKLNRTRFRRKPLPLMEQEYNFIKELIEENKSRITPSENLLINKIHARVFRRKAEKTTNCASCLIQMVNDLKEIYKTY